MAIDQFGNQWALEYKGGAVWARGKDDDGKECVRYVSERRIIVDLSRPCAFRSLTLTNDPMAIHL